MNKQAVALVALFAGWTLTADIADATTYEDIAGQWCGDVTDYVFAPNTLTVKFHDGRPANVFKIAKYTYTNDSVRIDWLNDGKESVTVFAEFSGKAMAQQGNEDKPRRAFHRSETSSFLLWSPTCFWKFGPRAKQEMRPLLLQGLYARLHEKKSSAQTRSGEPVNLRGDHLSCQHLNENS